MKLTSPQFTLLIGTLLAVAGGGYIAGQQSVPRITLIYPAATPSPTPSPAPKPEPVPGSPLQAAELRRSISRSEPKQYTFGENPTLYYFQGGTYVHHDKSCTFEDGIISGDDERVPECPVCAGGKVEPSPTLELQMGSDLTE